MEKAEKKVYEKPQITHQQDLEATAAECPRTSANPDACPSTGKGDASCAVIRT